MSGAQQFQDEEIRILFVDDEEMLLQSCSRLLRQLERPERVQTAKGGPIALEKLAEAARVGDPYEAIISDLIMPTMNGAELLDEVRRTWPDTVRVLLSGQSDLIARSNVAAAQMRFRKPSDIVDVLRWIQHPVRLGRSLTAETRAMAQKICSDHSIDKLPQKLGLQDEVPFLNLYWVQDKMEAVIRDREDRRGTLQICLAAAKEMGMETTQCVANCAGTAIVTNSASLGEALDEVAELAKTAPHLAVLTWLSRLAGGWFPAGESERAGLYLLAIWGLSAGMLDQLSGGLSESTSHELPANMTRCA